MFPRMWLQVRPVKGRSYEPSQTDLHRGVIWARPALAPQEDHVGHRNLDELPFRPELERPADAQRVRDVGQALRRLLPRESLLVHELDDGPPTIAGLSLERSRDAG